MSSSRRACRRPRPSTGADTRSRGRLWAPWQRPWPRWLSWALPSSEAAAVQQPHECPHSREAAQSVGWVNPSVVLLMPWGAQTQPGTEFDRLAGRSDLVHLTGRSASADFRTTSATRREARCCETESPLSTKFGRAPAPRPISATGHAQTAAPRTMHLRWPRLSRIEDAFDETGVAPPLLGPAQRHRDRPPLADEDAQLLCARDRGVEQRPRKHVRIRRRPRRDDRRELRSLCPVHGQRPGEAVGLEGGDRHDDLALAVVE